MFIKSMTETVSWWSSSV